MSFLDSFLEYGSKFESPTSFWKWAGYSAVAAVLRDNVYRKRGLTCLFPNIYVLIVADSSQHRKNHPLDAAGTLIKKVNNTKLLSGSYSFQFMLMELARMETSSKSGVIEKKAGCGLFLAQELSA